MTQRFSEALRDHAGPAWARAVDHRLFGEIIADTVEDRHFDRYLRIEFAFIDTAAIALGAAVRLAPDITDRTRLAAGLHDLLTSQVEFFEDALGNDTHTLRPPRAQPLHATYERIAAGQSYAQLLAVMLSAEWLYRTWCDRTVEHPSSRPVIRAWAELHVGPAFAEHAAWLKARLDDAATGLDDRERSQVADVFREVLEAEISFHDAVYDANDERPSP